MSEYNPKNYTEQGGDKTVIGGSLEFLEGAEVKNYPGENELKGRVSTLEDTVSTLEGQVSTLEDTVSALDGQVSTLSGQLTALTARVDALVDGNDDEY